MHAYIYCFPLLRFVLDDVEKQWPRIDANGDDYVTWEEYHNLTYGMISMATIVDAIILLLR